MTTWLTTAELAERCGTDTFTTLAALELLGLADGAAPSPLASRHGLADVGRESGALWHADSERLLRAVVDTDASGTGAAEPVDNEVQGVLPLAGVDEEVEGYDDAAASPAPAQPAGGGSPVGSPRPGFAAVLATDGACSGNPGPGGWAWVEQLSGARNSGGAARTTNSIMELTALIEGLEYVAAQHGAQAPLLIRADSQYVINVMTKWARGWRAKGWKKADGKPVKNRDLVERLLNLYEARTGRTEVEWVKGHAGDAANELVDSLAVARSREFSRRG
ncbi:ribonuclease H family protein [Actinotignum timonense]|uniref:ribonuclease H family protein n=1 Tax=Actinotignum timonense TaxID=1870995 RepID=UPI000B35B4D2|nr:ribonuclease H [Actinotignum timonense]